MPVVYMLMDILSIEDRQKIQLPQREGSSLPTPVIASQLPSVTTPKYVEKTSLSIVAGLFFDCGPGGHHDLELMFSSALLSVLQPLSEATDDLVPFHNIMVTLCTSCGADPRVCAMI